MRVGFGFDAHELVVGRKLKLGGVDLEFEKGLRGHSDGDVVLHALSDAILGACSKGDIGMYFRDDDKSIAGIDSREIVRHVMEQASASKMQLANIDVVVIADRPKLNTHYKEIAECIASQCHVSPSSVSIKSKTTEGTVISKDAIGCFAIVLMEEL